MLFFPSSFISMISFMVKMELGGWVIKGNRNICSGELLETENRIINWKIGLREFSQITGVLFHTDDGYHFSAVRRYSIYECLFPCKTLLHLLVLFLRSKHELMLFKLTMTWFPFNFIHLFHTQKKRNFLSGRHLTHVDTAFNQELTFFSKSIV